MQTVHDAITIELCFDVFSCWFCVARLLCPALLFDNFDFIFFLWNALDVPLFLSVLCILLPIAQRCCSSINNSKFIVIPQQSLVNFTCRYAQSAIWASLSIITVMNPPLFIE